MWSKYTKNVKQLYEKISLKQLLMCANILCIFVIANMNCVSVSRGKEENMRELCPLQYPLIENALPRSVALN